MIEFANSDSTIWNRDQLIIDIALAMSRCEPNIILSTKGEGPCAASLGLYELLDRMCERFDYAEENISIVTCNLAETHDRYRIIIDPQILYLRSAQKYTPTSSDKTIEKHFGHFIGHSNYPRLYLGSYLHRHYSDQTVQTYHTAVTDPYHRSFIGLEDMMFQGHTANEIQNAVDLLRVSPLRIDKIDQYPILNPTTLNITKVYPSFFVEIVNLTYWSGNTFYIDEKIWRPMLMRTPFVVHGPQNFIKRQRNLGFRTFEAWWDEGYSEDPPDYQLLQITHIIDQLASCNVDDLTAMYQDMQSTVEHNYQLMKQIQKNNLHA